MSLLGVFGSACPVGRVEGSVGVDLTFETTKGKLRERARFLPLDRRWRPNSDGRRFALSGCAQSL